MIQPRKWKKSPLRWLPILKFSDSCMPLHSSAICPSSILTSRVNTTQETWGGSERQGHGEGQVEEWYHRSLEDGSRLCEELPRVFLPQKFHLASVIALAMGPGEATAGLPWRGLPVSTSYLCCLQGSRRRTVSRSPGRSGPQIKLLYTGFWDT